MGPVGKHMHIDRPDEIAVTGEAAGTACPVSVLGLVSVSTSGTPARCSSFGAGEARDVSVFAFVGEIVNVFAVFPQRHALVVVSATRTGAHALRIADEEAPHAPLHAEVDDGPRRFMAQIADTPLRPPTDRILGALQFLPASRVLRAMGLLFDQLTHLPIALSLERADTAPSYDQGSPGIRSNSREVDFAQVYCRLSRSRRRLGPWDFHADVQLEAAIPDQGTGAGFFRQIKRQHEGFSPFAHRQDHPSLLFRDSLGGPVDRVEAFRPPRISHPHCGMGHAQLAGRVDGAEEGSENCLDRLAMQGETVLGGLMQLVLSGPRDMPLPRRLMQVTAGIPHRCRLHLSRLEATEECRGGVQSIHTYCFHILLFFISVR